MEHPSVAIHLETRFPSVQLQRDVRALLLDYPEKAISEPDSLRLLVGPSLPLDLSSQLKVNLHDDFCFQTLTSKVPFILGCGQPNNGGNILPTGIWKPSIHPPIRYASFRVPSCRRNVLLCTTDCTSVALRRPWLCTAIHNRDSQVLPAFCTSNHLEYDGKRLQRRGL